MCLYPKLIQNRKYIANKKNGGNVPEIKDQRTQFVPVGCGKCMECLKQKGREWKVRLFEEIKTDNTGKFVTLTFSDESYRSLWKDLKKEGFDLLGYELDNKVATLGTRRFLERWRKKHKKSVKHWLITELGNNNTERIHIHGLLFTDEVEEIKKIWNYGHVFIGSFVNEKSINYITKYVTKTDLKHKEYKPKILTSKGIGKGYLNSPDANNIYFQGKETIEYYRDRSGNKLALPIYYRNWLFDENEREALWIQKLDEDTRYVLGKKCKDFEEYKKLQKDAQEKNMRLGFGNDKINYELRRYEYQMKKMKQLKILQNGKSNTNK